jgi:lipopolysaccharide exporter
LGTEATGDEAPESKVARDEDQGPEYDRVTSHLLESGVDLATAEELPDATEDLTSKASRGFIWAIAGFLTIQIGGLGTLYFVSRTLTRDEFGTAVKVMTFVFWMDVLLDMGMAAKIIHEQERGVTHRVRVAFTINTIVSFIVAGLMLVFSPMIADFFGIPDSANLFRLLALTALIKGFASIPDSMMRRDLNFKPRTAQQAARAVIRFVSAIVLVNMGWGAASLVVAVIIADACGAVLISYFARFVPRFAFDWETSKEMLRYGLTIFAERLLGMVWLNGDYLVVGSRRSNGDFADYYTAFRLPELLLGAVYNIFSSVLFPAYSAAREKGAETLRSAYLRSLNLLWLYGATMAVGLALIARDFITIAFPNYPGAVVPMQLLSLAGAFVSAGYASGDLYNAIGKPKLGLYFTLGAAPILITGLLVAVPHGIVAVAAVHLIIIVPYSVFRLAVANREIDCKWSQTLEALKAGTGTALGVILFGLPIRLTLDSGFLSAGLIVVAGVIGAILGLVVADRRMFGELRLLALKSVGRT